MNHLVFFKYSTYRQEVWSYLYIWHLFPNVPKINLISEMLKTRLMATLQLFRWVVPWQVAYSLAYCCLWCTCLKGNWSIRETHNRLPYLKGSYSIFQTSFYILSLKKKKLLCSLCLQLHLTDYPSVVQVTLDLPGKRLSLIWLEF